MTENEEIWTNFRIIAVRDWARPLRQLCPSDICPAQPETYVLVRGCPKMGVKREKGADLAKSVHTAHLDIHEVYSTVVTAPLRRQGVREAEAHCLISLCVSQLEPQSLCLYAFFKNVPYTSELNKHQFDRRHV